MHLHPNTEFRQLLTSARTACLTCGYNAREIRACDPFFFVMVLLDRQTYLTSLSESELPHRLPMRLSQYILAASKCSMDRSASIHAQPNSEARIERAVLATRRRGICCRAPSSPLLPRFRQKQSCAGANTFPRSDHAQACCDARPSAAQVQVPCGR